MNIIIPDNSSQNAERKSGQSSPEKNKEFPKKKPAVNDPVRNDLTRDTKPPLIISKL